MVLSGVGCPPHDGCQGCDAARWKAIWPGICPVDPRPLRGRPHRRPGKDSASAGAELVWRIARQAAFSRVHQNSVPSVQMQCRMTAILRATAMRAFLPPIRFAKRMPQAFNGENR